jgi:hypothetical protein
MTRASKTMEERVSQKNRVLATTTTTNCQKHKVLNATQKRKEKARNERNITPRK